MSGGSLGYLYCKEVCDLFSCYSLDCMKEVEQTLLQMGYGDIAKDVRRLIEYIKSAENRIGVLHEQLEDVFHAVEWWRSADYGDGTLAKHLDAYREGRAEP